MAANEQPAASPRSDIPPDPPNPEGKPPTVIRAFARRNARHGWETLIPEFSIAGMGDTFDDALENAIELLDDYLLLCERDGMSFAEALRPLPLTSMMRLLAEFAAGKLVGKLSFGDSANSLPRGIGTCHASDSGCDTLGI